MVAFWLLLLDEAEFGSKKVMIYESWNILSLLAVPGSLTMKIYISADFEGISGVANWEEVINDKPDFDYFRKLMVLEVNAAVEASFENGATKVVVKDAHASARNILPTLLHRKTLLFTN